MLLRRQPSPLPLPLLPVRRLPVVFGDELGREELGREELVRDDVDDGRLDELLLVREVELGREEELDGCGACVVVGAGATVVDGAGGGVYGATPLEMYIVTVVPLRA